MSVSLSSTLPIQFLSSSSSPHLLSSLLQEIRGAAGLQPQRPRAEADLPLCQDLVQRRSAHLRVRHRHTGEIVSTSSILLLL